MSKWEPTEGMTPEEIAIKLGGGDRYWQKWNDDSISPIVNYWEGAPEQIARREHTRQSLKSITFGNEKKLSHCLDFGCGTGLNYQTILDLGCKYAGVDITDSMLEAARRAHPGIDVSRDDIFKSKWPDLYWPWVLCDAVLPHLPENKIPIAIGELWRIAQYLLVVRVFGIGKSPEPVTMTHKGFLYQWWPLNTWNDQFAAVRPRRIVAYPGNGQAKDCAVFAIWR